MGHSAGGGVNKMNSALRPVREREATLAFEKPSDERAALIWLDSRQSATEQRPPDRNTTQSLLLRFLYWIYERRLLDQLKQRPIPHHIGIILDGNRRHAHKRGVSDLCEIYQRGADKLDEILDWCVELQIPAVTLWVFSTENMKTISSGSLRHPLCHRS
jgi:hypothetical protein